MGPFVMKFRIKTLIRRALPQSVVNALRFLLLNLPRTIEKLRTQRIFAAAADAPSYLDISALETLQMKYPRPPEYGYDAHSHDVRGIERATQILRLPGAQEAHSFLELGCGDGMVSCYLCRKGKKATGIDSSDAVFDKRASREGVNLLRMDAADLRFEDESFDFVFSYDAFEHFSSPENVLREATRVVRKGGYIYLEFGPLYYSPYGEHAYHSITVPYCQILFQKNMINDFATKKGLDPIDFGHVNGWSLDSYRALWSKYSHTLKRVRYHEQLDLSHLSLIGTYPSCFKSKSNDFENFIITSISVLFQKTDHELPNNGTNSDTKS
jgi:ubiquinone/menaquinone biosynthesis C-methylase UbiE